MDDLSLLRLGTYEVLLLENNYFERNKISMQTSNLK